MKYFKMLKDGRAEWLEIDYENALSILRNNYSGEKVIKEMLKCEQTIPCLFCYIKVEAG